MKKQNKFISWIKNPTSDIWLFIIALILLNLVANKAFFRIDLTEQKSYSLSQSSKEVVKTLEEPLNVKVFFSSNLPSPYSNVKQYVQDILAEYKNTSSKNFNYEFFNMDKPDNQRIARGYGLNQIQIREIKNNEVGLKSVYMGIVLTYADQIEKLDGISSSEGFEYKFTSAIGKIISNTNILSGLSENIKVCLYKSESLADFNISGFDKIDSEVQKVFDSCNKKFYGKLEFQKENPDSTQAEELSKKYGIQSITWKAEDGQNHHASLGIVLKIGEKFRIVPFELQNAIFQYAVAGLDDLQENIEESIKSLVAKNSVIAYTTGHNENSLFDENASMNFNSILSDTYELEEVNLLENEIPISAQSLIINGPKEKFSDEELYKVDQFILRGGNVLFLVDSYNENIPQGQMAYYMQPTYEKVDTGLEKLFEKYGIEIKNEYVMDEKCFTRMNQQYGRLDFYYVPRLAKKSLNQKNAISKNLGDVFFLKASEIDVSKAQENKNAKVSIIAKTSERSWSVPVEENFTLSPLSIFPPKEESRFAPRNVAVLLEGKFDSAFDSPVLQEKQNENFATQNHLSSSLQNAKIFVASTSSITTAELIQQNSQEPIALFLRNAVDYMNSKEDLCSMRTKNLSLNTLQQVSGKLALIVKYFNQIGLSLIVIIIGLCVLVLRKKHREHILQLYSNENNKNEEA